MILFIGKENESFPLKEVAGEKQVEIFPSIDIKETMGKISEKAYSDIVINVANMINATEEIITVINWVKECTTSRIIILAKGYNPQTNIIQGLYLAGERNFILATSMTEEKDELNKCLKGYYDELDNELPFEQPKPHQASKVTNPPLYNDTKKNPNGESPQQKFTIGIAGGCHRIGTTTQAIQLCKYLKVKGYKACYIEMNQSGYFKELMTTIEPNDYVLNEDMGLLHYQKTDIYFNMKYLPQIKKMDYDYFIYDCGCIQEKEFNENNFLDKDLNIFVCGTKPFEYKGTLNIMQKTLSRDDCYYIFSFVEDVETTREELLEIMVEKAPKTSFAHIVTNPFVYSSNSNDTFDTIFHLQDNPKQETENPPKKNKRNYGKIAKRVGTIVKSLLVTVLIVGIMTFLTYAIVQSAKYNVSFGEISRNFFEEVKRIL